MTSEALEEWHRYTLPGFVERMRARLRGHCEQGHQPWPARGRHVRHTDTATRAERRDAFARDVDSNAVQSDARLSGPRRLQVVDLDTGEVRDEPPAW